MDFGVILPTWLWIVEPICSLILALVYMPSLIGKLHQLKFGQSEREEGLASHKKKAGTPTMGGIGFIVVSLIIFTVFSFFAPQVWNENTAIVLLSFVGYGLIGFIDDWLIVVRHNNDGLKPSVKFGMQSVLALIVFFLYMRNNSTTIAIPGTDLSLNLGWFYIIFIFIMFTGMSNAVNLSDGVDGLCAGLSFIALVPFLVLAYKQSQQGVAMICAIVMMALIGYLRYNWHPAKVFMGDTGSLALGGLLAAVAMVTKMELVLLVVSGVFIAETLSDIIQVVHYKRTHTRIFLMAPLHHHYEKKGWSEIKVVLVFWLWGAFFACLGLMWGLMAV